MLNLANESVATAWASLITYKGPRVGGAVMFPNVQVTAHGSAPAFGIVNARAAIGPL